MPIRNQHWYNLNEGIDFPLDDRASALGDSGERTPSDVLVDLNLRWPEHLGRRAFVGGLTVSSGAVSLVILACQDETSSGGFSPLAAITVPRASLVLGRQYAVTAVASGVVGWVVFGTGAAEEPFALRYSAPTQSLLAAKAARAYKQATVTGIRGELSGTPLVGVVKLRVESPLKLSKEERLIEGRLRDCIVVRLTDDGGAPSDPVFQRFAGPCAGRPESLTCGQTPIEYVNAVSPDCDGVLTLEFKGCATPSRLTTSPGVVLDCALGLADACVSPRLPDSDGELPGVVDPPPLPPTESETFESETLVAVALPHVDCFGNGTAAAFTVESGLWSFVEDDSPPSPCPDEITFVGSESASRLIKSYVAASVAGRNVSVWTAGDSVSLFRRVTTDVKMLAGLPGSRHNAAIVLNYKETVPGVATYWLAEIDFDVQALKISRFNGVGFELTTSTTIPGIQLDAWYRLSASVVPASPGTVRISASMQAISGGLSATLGPVLVAGYVPSDGHLGLGSYKALSEFAYFKVEEAHEDE